MNLEDRQQQLTRWIDGELEGEALRAFEAAAAEDPLLLEAKVEASLKQTAATLGLAYNL